MNAVSKNTSVEVVNFGCRLNAYRSEVMREHATAVGLTDTIIVNTCAVTKEAERQSQQAIRRLKRNNPTATIIATGCAAQLEPETYAAMPEVARVIGNEHKMKRESFMPENAVPILTSDIMAVRETAEHFWLRASMAAPALLSKCNKAAIIVARSALSPLRAAITVAYPWAALSKRSARSWPRASKKL